MAGSGASGLPADDSAVGFRVAVNAVGVSAALNRHNQSAPIRDTLVALI